MRVKEIYGEAKIDEYDVIIRLNSNIIMLPSFPELTLEEQIYICNVIKNII